MVRRNGTSKTEYVELLFRYTFHTQSDHSTYPNAYAYAYAYRTRFTALSFHYNDM